VGLIAGALVVVTVAQLALGIGQRASRDLLLGHAVLGIAVVLPLTIRLGIAVFLVSPDRPLVRRLGLALAVLVGLQTVLGVGLLLPRAALWSGGWTRDVHQSVGSLVVGLAAAVLAAARPTAAAGRRDPPASP
jgi:hypothetical protein